MKNFNSGIVGGRRHSTREKFQLWNRWGGGGILLVKNFNSGIVGGRRYSTREKF